MWSAKFISLSLPLVPGEGESDPCITLFLLILLITCRAQHFILNNFTARSHTTSHFYKLHSHTTAHFYKVHSHTTAHFYKVHSHTTAHFYKAHSHTTAHFYKAHNQTTAHHWHWSHNSTWLQCDYDWHWWDPGPGHCRSCRTVAFCRCRHFILPIAKYFKNSRPEWKVAATIFMLLLQQLQHCCSPTEFSDWHSTQQSNSPQAVQV